jgi:hypothetical protein
MVTVVLRLLAVLAMNAVLALPAHAGLGCEQLVASAQTGITLRDGGATLKQVLAETDTPAMRERFRPDELAMIRRAIQLTFTGEMSVYELAESCAANKGGGPRR